MDESRDAEALGRRLRMLRRSRGLSMRRLTAMIGLSAHSNLADYESGRRIPPQDIVEACERALGVTDGELSGLRRAALVHRSTLPEPALGVGPALAPPEHPELAGRPELAEEAAPAGRLASAEGLALAEVPELAGRLAPVEQVAAAGTTEPATGAAAPRRRRPSIRTRWALGLAVVLAASVGWWGTRGEATRPIAVRPAAVVMGVSSCDATAVILDTVDVTLPRSGRSPTLVGEISLRYSPSCALAWARFLPAGTAMPATTGMVLSVHRVSDGATTVLRLPQVVAVESDPLLTVPGCVYAEASIRFAGGATATARTACEQG